VLSDYALDLHGIHRPAHWLRVRENGLALAAMTPDTDTPIVELFALLHDCRRWDEGRDTGQACHEGPQYLRVGIDVLVYIVPNVIANGSVAVPVAAGRRENAGENRIIFVHLRLLCFVEIISRSAAKSAPKPAAATPCLVCEDSFSLTAVSEADACRTECQVSVVQGSG
jgi:hypothetical protein